MDEDKFREIFGSDGDDPGNQEMTTVQYTLPKACVESIAIMADLVDETPSHVAERFLATGIDVMMKDLIKNVLVKGTVKKVVDALMSRDMTIGTVDGIIERMKRDAE